MFGKAETKCRGLKPGLTKFMLCFYFNFLVNYYILLYKVQYVRVFNLFFYFRKIPILNKRPSWRKKKEEKNETYQFTKLTECIAEIARPIYNYW